MIKSEPVVNLLMKCHYTLELSLSKYRFREHETPDWDCEEIPI